MDMNQELTEVIDYLENWDIKPTKEKIEIVLNNWIENLYSHIGAEAHRYEIECGIADLTGMTWEEQDVQMLNQIEKYKKMSCNNINELRSLSRNGGKIL